MSDVGEALRRSCDRAGNPEEVEAARARVRSQPRALNLVAQAWRHSASVWEDIATGEQRVVPDKPIYALGLPLAFELAESVPARVTVSTDGEQP